MIVLRGLYGLSLVALGAAALLSYAQLPPWAWPVYAGAAMAFAIGLSGRTNWPFPLLVVLATVGLSVPSLQGFDPRTPFWTAFAGQQLIAHAAIVAVCLVLVVEGAARAVLIGRTKQRLGLRR